MKASSGHEPARPVTCTVTLALPQDLTAPAIARRFVEDNRDDLAPELIADAQLLVTEIVTNAVRYGREQITVALSLEPPGLGIAVGDAGEELPVMPTAPLAPVDSTRGRGMRIVEALATQWGVDVAAESSGKVVWFELQP